MRNSSSITNPDLEGFIDDRRVKLLHQVNILYNLLPTTQWIHLAAILVVFGLLFKHVDLLLLSSWLGFVFLVLLSRILINNYYRRSAKSIHDAEYWFNWFLVGTTLYGIMWSATAILLVPADDPRIVGFTALILSGLAAGGVAVSSVSSKVFLVYAISTMWPYGAFLISSGQDPHATIGLLILAFFFLVTIMAYHVNSFFTNLIDLQLKTYVLEKEVKQESEKRRHIEKALLDNTMEEGVADLIRQYSRVLKEREEAYSNSGPAEVVTDAERETDNRKLVHYLELFRESIHSNVSSALVFLGNVEKNVLNESHRKNIQIVEKILHEAKSAIEKSLSISGTETTDQDLEFDEGGDEKINLRRTLIYATHDIPLIYKAKYITIRRKIDKRVPQEVVGNKYLLEQIFRQVLINAYKYSDGGTINIAVDCQWEGKDEIQLRFEISDTGVGIPKDIVRHLQDDSRTDYLESGLGNAKRMVDKLGGNFYVESTLGVGSTITVDLVFSRIPEDSVIEHEKPE